MATPKVIGADKDLALDDLNKWVAQREKLMGPIVAIAHGQDPNGVDMTAGTFDLDQPRVKKNFAKVALKVGASCIVAGDETLVCEGEAFVSGVLNPVCVTRPKA